MKISPDYLSAAERELTRWPGAEISFQVGKVHPIAIIAFQGRTRKVFFPGSPSDSKRGAVNFLKDVRKELRMLGAVQAPKAVSAAPERPHRAQRRLGPKPPSPAAAESKSDNWLGPLQVLQQKLLAND